MSATTTNGTAAPPPPAVSPVEYVRGLPVEDQEEILVFLLKEAIRVQGGKTIIPIESETEDLGYYVPPDAANAYYEAFGPKLTPEREAELDERMTRLHEAQSMDEVRAAFKREAEELRRRPQSPSAVVGKVPPSEPAQP